MKYLVFGSLNIDKVYSLDHLPEKGETLSCRSYEIHVGGKGLNQSVSLANAGGDVFMAGCIGEDGVFLKDFLNGAGVDTSMIRTADCFTGHAVIEVDRDGQNQMILFAGANHEISEADCDEILSHFDEGDVILMQYETSCVEYMISKAFEKKMKIALNPSPFTNEINDLPFEKLDYLILNESEGASITGCKNYEETADALTELVPNGTVILTLGRSGAIFADRNMKEYVPAFHVDAVDTTGAGDTFTGYILTSLLSGLLPREALRFASAASAIAVTKTGAAETIPKIDEVAEFLKSV